MHILYNKLLNNAIYLVVYTVPEHGYVADYTYRANNLRFCDIFIALHVIAPILNAVHCMFSSDI